MTGIKKLFADAAKFLYLGVGISDPGTIPRKVDLWKLADRDEKSWRRFNLSASKLHHQGKEAVRLESCGEGLALFEAVELPVGKLNLSIASNQTSGQTVGVAIRAENQNRYELVLFDVLSDAS